VVLLYSSSWKSSAPWAERGALPWGGLLVAGPAPRGRSPGLTDSLTRGIGRARLSGLTGALQHKPNGGYYDCTVVCATSPRVPAALAAKRYPAGRV